MSRLFLFGRFLRSLFVALSAAKTVSNAVAMHRMPSTAALVTLGIDPELFRTIRFG